MDRVQKKQAVASLQEMLSSVSLAVVVHYKGLTVEEVTALRKKAFDSGVSFKVTKNSLARLALKDSEFADLTKLMKGPTAVAVSKDPVAAAKVIAEFAKENEKLIVLGGVLNKQVMDVATVNALATMPSLDELRAKLIAMINTPATRIAGVLQAPAGQLARVLNAYATKAGN